MRTFVFLLLGVLLVGNLFAADKPNILLIVGDDIGFGDLGISGSVTRTPNLDTLAQQGAFFTNFHVSPVCSVKRSMLLTGNDSIEMGLGAFDYTVYSPSAGQPGYEAYISIDLDNGLGTAILSAQPYPSGLWWDIHDHWRPLAQLRASVRHGVAERG